MHFGVTVADVPAVLEKVEALGGRAAPARQPRRRPARRAAVRLLRVDPDGHVFELMEMTVEQTVAEIHKNIAQMEKEIR